MLILSGLLAWVEVGWLKHAWQFLALWKSIAINAIYNFFFIFLTVAASGTYLMLFYFTLPLMPAIYIAGKIFLYFIVVKNPAHSIFLFSALTMPFFAIISYIFLTMFSYINPTLDNMKQAIEAKQAWSLETMMWLSIKNATDMRMLVNDAIVVDNPEALKILFRHGASPEEDYWIHQAKSPATQWLVLKFLIENGVGRQHYAIRLDEYALNYSVDVLKYCIDKGFDPKQYAHIMHYALTNQPLQSPSAVRPEEYQSIIQKMQLLLEHGADMNGEDHYKFTPLFTALGLQYDMAPVITFMITKGANVNAKSVNKLYLSNRRELPAGMTPLMLATATNQNRHVAVSYTHLTLPTILRV